MFFLGMIVSSVIWFGATVYVLCSKNSKVKLVDMYWTENPERWADLRQILINENKTEEIDE